MFGLPESAIKKLSQIFEKYPSVEKVIIYGSRAKGNFKNGSDIDLTMVGDISHKELLQISIEIDDLLLPYQVDLSIFSTLENDDLKEHIGRVGKDFYVKAKSCSAS